MAKYAKAVAAFLTALATWAGTALADGHVTAVEATGLLLVVATALGVYAIPNSPPPVNPDPNPANLGPRVDD